MLYGPKNSCYAIQKNVNPISIERVVVNPREGSDFNFPTDEGFTISIPGHQEKKPLLPGSLATKVFSKLRSNKGRVGSGQGISNPPSLGTCPKAPSGRVDPKISKEYQEFEEKMTPKKDKTQTENQCSIERFNELSTDTQTGKID